MDDIDEQAAREGQAISRLYQFNHRKRPRTSLTSTKGTNHVFGGNSKSMTALANSYGADGQIPA